MHVFVSMFAYLQQDGIYVNERFLHTFASCIVSTVVMLSFVTKNRHKSVLYRDMTTLCLKKNIPTLSIVN